MALIMNIRALIFGVLTLASVALAQAQLRIEITSGVTDPIPIAIVPFASSLGGLDVAGVVQHDLEGSGRFRALPRAQMSEKPSRAEEVVVANWRGAGNDYVVVGRISALQGEQLAVDFDLVNLLNGQKLLTQRFTANPATLRNAAHRVSDEIYQKI